MIHLRDVFSADKSIHPPYLLFLYSLQLYACYNLCQRKETLQWPTMYIPPHESFLYVSDLGSIGGGCAGGGSIGGSDGGGGLAA